MIFGDYHLHSLYSFDSESALDDICESAIARGLSEIAITDHVDCDAQISGAYERYEDEAAEEAILALKERYRGRLCVLYGAELGQPCYEPDFAENLLKKHRFDFILGSIHNLRNMPDFATLDYKSMSESELDTLFSAYLDELRGTVLFGRISSMAHLTYPLRYLLPKVGSFDITKYYEKYGEILSLMTERGIALEINTSGIKRNEPTLPEQDLVDLYVSLGGSLITVGSDAHNPEHIGSGLEVGYEMIKKAGLCGPALIRNGKLETVPFK